MKKTTLLFSCIIALSFVHAQPLSPAWAKQTNSGPNGYNCALYVSPTGYVYNTGTFIGTSDFDPGPGTYTLYADNVNDEYLTKMDPQGNLVWARYIVDTLVASTVSPGISDVDSYSGAEAPISIDLQGNIYRLGNMPYNNYFNGGGLVSKRDSSGNPLWTRFFSGLLACTAVSNDAYGNVYVSGGFSGTAIFQQAPNTVSLTSNGSFRNFALKLNSAGQLVWIRLLPGGMGRHSGDAAGNMYMIGVFAGAADFDPGAGTYTLSTGSTTVTCRYVLKLDSAGNFGWAKMFQGKIETTPGNNIWVKNQDMYLWGVLTGTVDLDPGPGTSTLAAANAYSYINFIMKMDTAGNFIWAKSLGNWILHVNSLITDQNGSVLMTGYYNDTCDVDFGPGVHNLIPFGGSGDIFLLKLDGNGNFMQAYSAGSAGNFDTGTSLVIDRSNNVYLNGYFGGTVDFDPGLGAMNLTCNPSGFYNGFMCRFDASGVTGIKQYSSDNAFNVYPNPASDLLTISFSANTHTGTLYLYDSSGRQISSQRYNSKTTSIDLSTIDHGLYILKVTDDNGNSTSHKFVKD